MDADKEGQPSAQQDEGVGIMYNLPTFNGFWSPFGKF